MKMFKTLSKILGGLLLAALMTTQVFAAAVTINVTGITNHSSSPLPAGAYVQVIQSSDATRGTPGTNGLPAGDTVVGTGTINPNGTFSTGASIPSNQYVYIRVWETWDGTGNPTTGTYYGQGPAENVGSGFVYTYDPAGFSTNIQFGITTLNITTTSLPAGTQGVAYSQTVSATGGTTPYTWSISVGSLPAGLTLNANTGLISGTPTATGTTNFTVRCQDSGAQSDTQALSITVNPGGTALNITTTSLPGGTVGQAYSQTVQATGGTLPYTWSISAGALPAGLALNANTGAITGTPTAVENASFTVRVQDSAAGSDTQALSINVTTGGGGGLTVTPSSAYLGQTIVITGSGFGATPTTVTVGGVAANPTTWSDTSVTCAVPTGATSGNVVIGADSGAITVVTTGVVIDDVEGGSVGRYPGAPLADSGYYQYDNGITPVDANINNDGPLGSPAHGAGAMGIVYSYATAGYGGGWGAKVSNALDLSSYSSISFYINWDGTSNEMQISLQDSQQHGVVATISNALLSANTGSYGLVTLQKSSFAADPYAATPGAIDWTDITNYGFSYTTVVDGTTTTVEHAIDSIYAGTVDWGTGPTQEATEVFITQVDPVAGPAGTKFTATADPTRNFGAVQGQSILIFENTATNTTYQCEVLSWSATEIEAIVPRLAPAGNYTLKVIKIAVVAGTLQAAQSNDVGFRVTAGTSSTGNATIYPNPFNPLETTVPVSRASGILANQTTIAYDATGVTNVGIYIYDSTARLVYREITTGGQVTWDGTDMNGRHVADGLYLLRVVNEDNKSLIAKGKILVIKQ